MLMTKAQRIQQYLDLITRGGGTEAVLSDLDSPELEAFALRMPGPAEIRLASARSGMESLFRGGEVDADQMANIEAIIIPSLRPVYDITDGHFDTTHFDGPATPGNALWTKLSTDATLKQRIERVFPAIGRIELLWDTNIPYGGTGFVVGKNLLMTNRHVAQIFAEGVGDRSVRFIDGRAAGIDFRRDTAEGTVIKINAVKMIHPYWDMAILQVEGLPAGLAALPLAVADARDLIGQEVVVIGYPAFDNRNPADVQTDLLHGRFQVKRLQPGLLQGAADTDSFGKIVPAATHDCSTLGGNSGSALLDLTSGEIVGLHFAGRYLERNYAVPMGALAQDGRVVDLGLNFAGTASRGPNSWGDWWANSDAAAPEAAGGGSAPPVVAAANQPQMPPSGAALDSTAPGSVTFEVPLRITISLGAANLGPVSVAQVASKAVPLEAAMPTPPGNAMVPKLVADYVGRKGYDADFLSGGTALPGVAVPMPEAADDKVLAALKSGGTRLDYQNFSIKIHAARRLALITASNVTQEALLRQPVAGRDYTRHGLFTEHWFPDARLDDTYQIPDVFYANDHGAFDKGHIVRRDDVAWGNSFDQLVKGNVDSFHVTNCSPQVEGYNRSASGARNWGDLENHVLSEAASERLCVFAGSILAADDRIFAGSGPKGITLRAPVPRRFWKVVVARVSDGLAAYGFILEQDLSTVTMEFTVSGVFICALYPLAEIASLAGVVFDQAILDADQYSTERGAEVALRAGAIRKSGAKP